MKMLDGNLAEMDCDMDLVKEFMACAYMASKQGDIKELRTLLHMYPSCSAALARIAEQVSDHLVSYDDFTP